MIPIKGPQGKGFAGGEDEFAPDIQEEREDNGAVVDYNPQGLKSAEDMHAGEGDHTPDNSFITHAPRVSKPNYGKHEGRGNGGVGL